MFEPTASVIPIQNSELTDESRFSGYNWKTLAKAGLVFVMTTGAFLTLKTMGSFNLISSCLKNKEKNLDEQEAKLSVSEEAERLETYFKFPDFKESPLATSESSHKYTIFTPQRVKRNPSGVLEKIGPEFQANTYTIEEQMYPHVIKLNDGKFVVVWQSDGQDAGNMGVYGQIFNANATRFLSEFRVNTNTFGNERPSVAILSNDKFVVVWNGGGSSDIYGQIFNTDGSKYGSEFRVNTYTENFQWRPSVAGLTDGKFVVTWGELGGSSIYGQIFDANGTEFLSEFQVNTYTTGAQYYPSVAGLSDGKFVIVWASSSPQDRVCAQMYHVNGTTYGCEFQVNTYVPYIEVELSAASLSDGKFVVAWNGQDVNSTGVCAQIFDSNGSKFLSEFQVNTYTGSDQLYPSVASLSDGKFVVTWQSYGQGGCDIGIYGQMFDNNGSKFLSEFQVNDVISSQQYSSVAGSDGKFMVTWVSFDGYAYGIYGQIFNINETFVSSDFSSSQQISKSSSEVSNSYSPTASSLETSNSITSASSEKSLSHSSERSASSTKRSSSLVSSMESVLPSGDSGSSSNTISQSSSSSVGSTEISNHSTPISSSLKISSSTTSVSSVENTSSLSKQSNSSTKENSSLISSTRGSSLSSQSIISSVIISQSDSSTEKSSLIISSTNSAPLSRQSSFQDEFGFYQFLNIILGISISSVALLCTIIGVGYWWKRKHKKELKEEIRDDEKHQLVKKRTKKQEREVKKHQQHKRDEDSKQQGLEGKLTEDQKAREDELKEIYVQKQTKNKYWLDKQEKKDLKQGKVPIIEMDKLSQKRAFPIIPYDQLRVGDRLGEGSFGVVYKGKWQHSEVAIKQLKATKISAKSIEEFKREALTMADLRHPNIIEFYGISIDLSGKYSMVMEYASCGSLYTMLHNQQPLEWSTRYSVAGDITSGLTFLHSKNILHRDLKSLNVLLYHRDDRIRAKLTDFGLSKVKSEISSTTTAENDRSVGTLPWMAPELFQPKAKYTKKSDMYSYGVVLWELASRKVPFIKAGSPALIIQWVREGEREDIPDNCPPAFAKLIQWCWQQKAEKRPTTDEVAKTLTSIQLVLVNTTPDHESNLDSNSTIIPDYRFFSVDNTKPSYRENSDADEPSYQYESKYDIC